MKSTDKFMDIIFKILYGTSALFVFCILAKFLIKFLMS